MTQSEMSEEPRNRQYEIKLKNCQIETLPAPQTYLLLLPFCERHHRKGGRKHFSSHDRGTAFREAFHHARLPDPTAPSNQHNRNNSAAFCPGISDSQDKGRHGNAHTGSTLARRKVQALMSYCLGEGRTFRSSSERASETFRK